MKILLLSTGGFLLSLAVGKFAVQHFPAQKAASPGAIAAPPAILKLKRPAQTSPLAFRAPAEATTMLDHIAWEKTVWEMDSGDLARRFEEEARTASSGERMLRFLSIWQERDPDGLIAWARTKPDEVLVGKTGQQIGLSHTILKAATRKNPEYAWKLAAETAGNSHFLDTHRGLVIGLLLEQDPQAALAFVKKHRTEIAAFSQGNIGWYNHDPQLALPVAMELPPGAVRTSIVAELARYYGERPDAIAAAQEWFQSLPQEHQKEVSKLPYGQALHRLSETHRQQLKEVWPALD